MNDLRPLDLPALMDRSIELYRQNFLLFVGLAAVFYVPYGLVTLLSAFLGEMVHMVVIWLGGLIMVPVWPLLVGAMIQATSNLYLGLPADFKGCYRAALQRFVPLVGTGLLLSVILFPAMLMLLLPGLAVAVFTAFAFHAVMLEDSYYDRALSRSFHLNAHDWHRTLGLMTVLFLLQMALTGVPTGLILTLIPDPSWTQAANAAWSALASTVLVPVQVIPYVLLYFDLRIRHEAMDLRILADRLGPAPVVPAQALCASCRAPLVAGAAFCTACGRPVRVPA